MLDISIGTDDDADRDVDENKTETRDREGEKRGLITLGIPCVSAPFLKVSPGCSPP